MTFVSPTPATTPVSLHEQKQNATFRAQQLSAVPSDLLTMRNLVMLDVSYNRLTRLPGALLAQDMPRLEVLSLQHNLLYVLEDVLALSVASRLRELNVSANPLRLVNNRIYFLEALFGAPGCDTKTLRTVHKDDTLTAHARSLAAAFTTTRPSATSSKKARVKSSSTTHTMVLVHKLPRRTGFPMLQKLNGQWITDDDVHAVESERGRAVEYYVPVARAHAVDTSGLIPHDRSVAVASVSNAETLQEPPAKGRRFDGSRMTAKELLKTTTRSAAIPNATVIHRFQIDVESNRSVPDQSSTQQAADDGDDCDCDEYEVVRRLFARDNSPRANSRLASESRRTEAEPVASSVVPPSEQTVESATVAYDSSWNYPIRSFDELTSDDRQYIRLRSKQSVESNLQRDDHFFESSIFLDCVAQAERSRRLTLRAVDALCPIPQPASTRMSGGTLLTASKLAPSLFDRPVSTAAAQLRETLATKFSKALDQKEYAKLEAFLANPPPQLAGAVDGHDMQAALSEFFVSEHLGQHQHTRQLLAAHSDATAPTAANSQPLETVSSQLDDSLSKSKLRNAVDLANALRLNKKQEKRMMQMLIDADARAIEQERAGLEQALHRHRLDLIASNQFYATPQAAHEADREWMAQAAKHKTPSPWQARNWRAKDAARHAVEQQQRAEREAVTLSDTVDVDLPDPTQLDLPAASSSSGRRGRRSAGSKPPRASIAHKKTTKPTATTAATVSTRTRPASASAVARKLEMEPTAAKFRAIETVEQAASDSLAHVNSHDLLVHCAAIRHSAEDHAEALAQYRDRFLEDEAAWEAMRQDPINIVRRHLRRKLYQDAQEVQIAGTQLFYSPLFQ